MYFTEDELMILRCLFDFVENDPAGFGAIREDTYLEDNIFEEAIEDLRHKL